MANRRLDPSEMYPAGAPGVTASTVRVRTGVQLRVAQSGRPGAPVVLMLHGWGASLYMHRHLLGALGAAGYHAIAPDLRGHGLSDKPMELGAYTLDAFLDDSIALIDSLGASRVVVLGQSMGGAVALQLALRGGARVAAMVLVNSVGLGLSGYPMLGRAIGRRAMRRLSSRIPPRWLVSFILRRLAYGDASRVTERDVDEYWACCRDPRYAAAVHAMLREFDWRPVSPEDLRRLRVPALVVLGESDRILRRIEALTHALPSAVVESMAGGHSVNEECGVDFSERVLRFLREKWPPDPEPR